MTGMGALSGKRVIVTGGTSGMGAALVTGYAREGASVVALHRSGDGSALLAAVPPQAAERIKFLRCDVSDKAQVDEAVAAAVAWLGGLDGLAHAAGIAPGAPAEDITLDAWENVFATNARSTFLTNQAVFPHLRERGGKILNFASATGVQGAAGKAHYAASKGAVLAWTRSIAKEWGRYGIAINAVAPAIWTPMYDKTRAAMLPEELAAHDAAMGQVIAIGGRLGDVERDFLPYLIFLMSDGAGFITGQTLKIDGGLLML